MKMKYVHFWYLISVNFLTKSPNEYLELASAMYLEDEFLMTMFHGGLDETLWSKIHWDSNNWLLQQYTVSCMLSRSAARMPHPFPAEPESVPVSIPAPELIQEFAPAPEVILRVHVN